ncbi:N-acetylmuramoyl-L-alanine amidase [Brachybacterium sp. JHP9]|uniref:N-acetylmuramoyl-L-alanine amidase n=1 Tax=Brachybacterium equifaecis TaxID=2910770 RepID=A0ABT0R4L4_9MICO|nr:N-acetylmuramoyl-L-alanine amidase [Brachybacterium equifaecis]MCL6424358.1 N-acetylmuramoyl-L-alanine amidase [Brachybacterium equifaecis]
MAIGLESRQGVIARLQSILDGHMNHPTEPYVDIAYNWAVDQVGRIWELRGKRQSGANGTSESNRVGQSILCLVGNTEAPTTELVASVNHLITYIREWQPSALSVFGHQDSVPTQCPGQQIMKLIAAGAFGGVSPIPKFDDGNIGVPIPEIPGMQVGINVDGRLGEWTVKVLQRRLGITADGRAGSGTWRALQSFLGTPSDGIVANQSYTADELGNGISGGWQFTGRNSSGSSMVRALQAYIGVSVDGVWGEGTTAALQRYLNNHESAFTGPGVLRTELGITVDGRFGPSTVRVLQARLGVVSDGKAGSGTWRALQSFLGTSVDGVVSNQSYAAEELGSGITGGWQYTGRNSSGSSMVRALQAYIGTSIDGVWGTGVTSALQRHLNRYDSAFR